MSQYRINQAILLVSVVIVFAVSGCSHEEIPVPPNARTAAPARLPGEDPHAPPDRMTQHKSGK